MRCPAGDQPNLTLAKQQAGEEAGRVGGDAGGVI